MHKRYEVSDDLIKQLMQDNIPFELDRICGWNGCPNGCIEGTQVLVMDKRDIPEELKVHVFHERGRTALLSDRRVKATHPSIQKFLEHRSELEDFMIESRLSFNGISNMRFCGECVFCDFQDCIFNRHKMEVRLKVGWDKEIALQHMVEISRSYPSLLFMGRLNLIPRMIEVIVNDDLIRRVYGHAFRTCVHNGEVTRR